LKVLFVYPDFPAHVDSIRRFGFYSEGLASLSAVLKKVGHAVSLYHLTGPANEQDFKAKIEEEQPDLIAFTVRTTIFPYVKEYLKWSKSTSNALTVCGGYHPTIAPEETVNTEGVDVVAIGEGEGALQELCEKIEKKESFDYVANLWVKKEDTIIRNPVRPLIEDLDALPLPDFALFDYEKLESSTINTASAMLSRGCPYSCTYCCNHKIREVYPNPQKYARFRSPDRSIEYLKKILDEYPFIKYINFMDNILPMRRSWFFEFIDLYKREIDLPFSCNFRVNLVKEDVVKALKDAKCFQVRFGVESGDDFIRNTILKRKISRQDMVEALRACRDLGISTLSYNMVGLPHEDLPKALETIKLNAEMMTTRVVVSVFYPYPNTEAYDMSVKDGFIEPTFDYREDVALKQDKFGKEAVNFVATYFETFMKLYKFSNRMPKAISKRMEMMLDRLFCSRLLPRYFLVKVADVRDRYIEKAKTALKKRLPGFYLFLRDKLLRTTNS